MVVDMSCVLVPATGNIDAFDGTTIVVNGVSAFESCRSRSRSGTDSSRSCRYPGRWVPTATLSPATVTRIFQRGGAYRYWQSLAIGVLILISLVTSADSIAPTTSPSTSPAVAPTAVPTAAPTTSVAAISVPKYTYAYAIRTEAGCGAVGFADGNGTSACFNKLGSFVMTGDWLYLTDAGNNDVRLLSSGKCEMIPVDSIIKCVLLCTGWISTLAGFIETTPSINPEFSSFSGIGSPSLSDGIPETTLTMASAAYADGYASDARFNDPHGIAFAASSMNFLICDTGNNVIRTVSVGGNVVSATTTLTPGSQDGSAASFNAPWGIAVNIGGTAAYITDTNNNLVRLLQISSGIAS
jgi:hypothetical protein